MRKGRKNLDWNGMCDAALDAKAVDIRQESHKKEKVCSMCVCVCFCSMDMLNDKL